VYLSTDGGISWTEPDSGFVENINRFAMIGETLFVGTNDGVFLSTNSGTSWSPVNTGMTHQVMGLASIGTNLFAGTPLAGVFLSTNNGASWSAVDTGLSNLHIYGLAVIGSDIFAGAFQSPGDSTGGVFVSTYNGATWHVADSGLTTHTINVLTASGTNLFAGTNSGVYISSDNGARWIDISSGTPFGSIGALALAVSDSFLFAGTNGNGVWRYPLSQLSTGVDREVYQRAVGFELEQNYPNPFNPTTTIRYGLPSRSHVTLSVYNTLGQQLGVLVNGDIDPGNHEVTFDGSNLPSGVYFYRLQAGSYIQTKKLLILR
jgi:ligand-binding sensor domain-containing protein